MLFVSISNWLKSQAETSSVLSNFSIKRIYNNIDIDNFKIYQRKCNGLS